MSEVQAVLFNKHLITKKKAREWLKRNKMQPIKKVHTTKNLYRYRINPPKKYKKFRYKKINDHMSFIIGFK